MAKTSPFLFPSTFPSHPSESSPPSSPSSSPSFPSSRSNSSFSFNSPYKSLSSLSQPPLSHSSSSRFPPAGLGPCAACKFHGRRCSDNCYLASFFPPNEAHKFAVVDSVFGSASVGKFLEQQNSKSSYIPLLFLLRDTTREDGELHSDSKKNTLSETYIHNQLGAPIDSDHIRELTQGRELAKQLEKHLSSESSVIIIDLVQRILSSFDKSLSITNLSCSTSQLHNDVSLAAPASDDPTVLPIYMNGSPATVNFNAVLNDAATRRKALPRLTDHARVRSVNGMEGPPDDGYKWRKYGQKHILGAIFPEAITGAPTETLGSARQQSKCKDPMRIPTYLTSRTVGFTRANNFFLLRHLLLILCWLSRIPWMSHLRFRQWKWMTLIIRLLRGNSWMSQFRQGNWITLTH